MSGLLLETVNHKLSANGILLWVPTLGLFCRDKLKTFDELLAGAAAVRKNPASVQNQLGCNPFATKSNQFRPPTISLGRYG